MGIIDAHSPVIQAIPPRVFLLPILYFLYNSTFFMLYRSLHDLSGPTHESSSGLSKEWARIRDWTRNDKPPAAVQLCPKWDQFPFLAALVSQRKERALWYERARPSLVQQSRIFISHYLSPFRETREHCEERESQIIPQAGSFVTPWHDLAASLSS